MKVNKSMYSMKQNKEQVFCYYSEKISYHIGIKIKKENERDGKNMFCK